MKKIIAALCFPVLCVAVFVSPTLQMIIACSVVILFGGGMLVIAAAGAIDTEKKDSGK